MLARLFSSKNKQITTPDKTFPLLDLPEEVLIDVFARNCPIEALGRLASVSRVTHRLFQPQINLEKSLKTAIVMHAEHLSPERNIFTDQDYWAKYQQASSPTTMTNPRQCGRRF